MRIDGRPESKGVRSAAFRRDVSVAPTFGATYTPGNFGLPPRLLRHEPRVELTVAPSQVDQTRPEYLRVGGTLTTGIFLVAP